MVVAPAVRPVVEEVVGRRGDPTVLDYVINVLEDEDFEFGTEGKEAYDAFAEMLVGALFAVFVTWLSAVDFIGECRLNEHYARALRQSPIEFERQYWTNPQRCLTRDSVSRWGPAA